MSRKPIANLDEKILKAAVEVGGSNRANVDFSTKEIARRVGVSEFTIFQRFKNKDEMISRALLRVSNEVDSYMAHLINDEHLPYATFVCAMADYFIAHPTYTFYLANYSQATSRISSDASSFARYYAATLKESSLFYRYFDLKDETQAFLIVNALIRRILMDALFVLAGLIPDSPTYRERATIATIHGLKGLQN